MKLNDDLTLFMYPKNADVACLVIKNETELFRENHLFNYALLADNLERICAKIDRDHIVNDCLSFCDKRGYEYFMVCAFDGVNASLVISRKISRRKKNPALNWKGTVAVFINAVHEMLRRLGRRS
jgi:hypothetical protein